MYKTHFKYNAQNLHYTQYTEFTLSATISHHINGIIKGVRKTKSSFFKKLLR